MARAMTRPKPIGRLLTYKDLHEVGVSFSRNYFRKLINDDKFPQPIRVGPCKLVWDEAAIRTWIEERPSDERDDGGGACAENGEGARRPCQECRRATAATSTALIRCRPPTSSRSIRRRRSPPKSARGG